MSAVAVDVPLAINGDDNGGGLPQQTPRAVGCQAALSEKPSNVMDGRNAL